MHHPPLIKFFVEKRETTQLVEFARRSAGLEQDFRVLHSGWARKTVPFDTEKVLSQLARIDVANRNNVLSGAIQSKHFGRIYEYPHAIYHLRDVRKDGAYWIAVMAQLLSSFILQNKDLKYMQ
jgi:hypothetical protein